MYGWRACVGHVAPSRGDTLVYEFYRMLPEGFMILNSTGTIRQLIDTDFDKQLRRIEEAQDADGVFVPCPRWPTIGDVELLEKEIGKPVVTSCQAYIWYALKLIHIKEKVTGFGQLMATLGS